MDIPRALENWCFTQISIFILPQSCLLEYGFLKSILGTAECLFLIMLPSLCLFRTLALDIDFPMAGIGYIQWYRYIYDGDFLRGSGNYNEFH